MNPYLPLLDQAVALLLSSDPMERPQEQCARNFVHWDQENEWTNTPER